MINSFLFAGEGVGPIAFAKHYTSAATEVFLYGSLRESTAFIPDSRLERDNGKQIHGVPNARQSPLVNVNTAKH
jgi:hypothetical protein